MLPPAAHNALTDAPEAPGSVPTGDDAVNDDIACTACGYNIHGLTLPGRCPECAADLLPTVRAHQRWSAPLPPPDARWATHIVEGAALSLLSFVLLVVLSVAPDGVLYLPRRDARLVETPGRVVLLCVGCAAWVTSWYSVWKLSAQASAADTLTPRRRARVTRWVMTAYFVLPFLVGVAPGYSKNPAPFPLALLVLMLPLAGTALFSLIAGLFRRAGGGWARLEAVLLTAAAPVSLFLAASLTALVISHHSTRVSSLDLLYDLPLSPYAAPEMGRYLVGPSGKWRDADAVTVATAAVALWAAAMHLRLMLRYLPYTASRPAWEAGVDAPSVDET